MRNIVLARFLTHPAPATGFSRSCQVVKRNISLCDLAEVCGLEGKLKSCKELTFLQSLKGGCVDATWITWQSFSKIVIEFSPLGPIEPSTFRTLTLTCDLRMPHLGRSQTSLMRAGSGSVRRP